MLNIHKRLRPGDTPLVITAVGNTLPLQHIKELAEDGKMDEVIKEAQSAINKNFEIVLMVAKRNGFTIDEARQLFTETLESLTNATPPS